MNSSDHERFMLACLHLAEKGRGKVSPNPLVGAVLVKGGRIVAEGYHRRFGGPHAEVECLASYRGSPDDAVLYVNLEPCAHQGKTPPCADLIVRSGIRTVVVAMRDPNPLVDGRGIRKLRSSGVKVITGVLESESRRLNRAFITYVTLNRPFVHVKIAQTLDGKISSRSGTFTRITGNESHAIAHRMRAMHDAVLVGAGTVRIDNPRLTVRLVNGRDPAVVVIDGRLSLSTEARIWRSTSRRRIILLSSAASAERHARKVREFSSLGVEVVPVKSGGYHLPLKAILRELYKRGISSVLVEGGTNVLSQFISKGPVDVLSVFVAANVLGSGVPAFRTDAKVFRNLQTRDGVSARTVGRDVLIQYDFSSQR